MRALLVKDVELVEAGARFDAIFEFEDEHTEDVIADEIGAAVEGVLLVLLDGVVAGAVTGAG